MGIKAGSETKGRSRRLGRDRRDGLGKKKLGRDRWLGGRHSFYSDSGGPSDGSSLGIKAGSETNGRSRRLGRDRRDGLGKKKRLGRDGWFGDRHTLLGEKRLGGDGLG